MERLWKYPEQFSEAKIQRIIHLIRTGPLKLGVVKYQNGGSRFFVKLRGHASNLANFIEMIENKYSGKKLVMILKLFLLLK